MSIPSYLIRTLKRTSDRNRIVLIALPSLTAGLLAVFGLYSDEKS
jgi:hypothetical protein